MRKLAAGASKKQRRRLTEHRFEEKFAVELQALGLKSHHACPDWEPGVPDRYVCGGRWIEFKSLAYERSVMPWNALSPQQRAHLDEYQEAGDDCWVCILLCHEDDGDDDRVIFQRWTDFKKYYTKRSLTRDYVLQFFPKVNRRNPKDLHDLITYEFYAH